ncbi:MAG: protease inhibitor I42 family protein, partial [Phycisphaerae bacterium]|nr:protease inhibitor I42 family protein [Phycisphaerae bacterium]
MKRIAVGLSVLTVLVLAAPAGAELCEKCKGKMYIMSVGKCVECGGFTGSGAHKLCRKCSAKLGQCEHCRAPLKAAKQGATTKPVTHPNAKGWGPVVAGVRMRLVTDSGRIVEGELPKLAVVVENNSNRPIFFEKGGGKLPIFRDATLWNCNTAGREKQIANLRKNPGPHAPSPFGPFTEGVPPGKSVRLEMIDAMSLRARLTKTYPQKLVAVTNFYTSKKERWNLTSNILEIHLAPSPVTQPAAMPKYLRPLELDDSANGKTVSAIVGQQIIIRLKGAPVPGHMWNPAKLAGDAIEQVGQMKFVPDARPRPVFVPDPGHQQPVPAPNARPKPMPGGLVAHTVGGPGKYVFTFRAVKAGKAEVTIKGRVHRARRPVRTFALTVNVKADPTAERVKKLKANLDKFAMTISYQGRGPVRGAPRWCRNITLSVPPTLVPRTPSWQVRQISKEQAGKIIDQLAKAGFLARAVPRAPVLKKNQYYVLAVRLWKPGPGSPMLMDIRENIGWGPQLLKRLEDMGLKEVLDGDAAKAVDFLIEPIREKFGKEDEKPAPAKIDTKKSGTYTSGKWKYQYTIRAVGTRSERRFSGLTYDGNLIAGAKMWDRIKTPWGMMQYYQMSYVRGWMLELTGGTPINPKKG